MKPYLTGKAYDEITDLWGHEKFNNDYGIAPHKRSLEFVVTRGVALDVGCGCNSRFKELLSDAGFEYEGLDVSEEMIKLARENDPDTTYYCEDVCEWKSTRKYDYITAWDSIWHIPLDEHASLISKLVQALNPGGVLIFSLGGTEEPNEHSNESMGPLLYYSTLGANAYLELILDNACACRHFEYDQYPEQHAYIIAQKLPRQEDADRYKEIR